MASLRTSAALTHSAQVFHVTSGKEAMKTLAQSGANAIHDHEISPLIHRAASELINRDDKGQKTDIMSVGFPHVVLMDVAQQLATLGITAFTSEQILEALQNYTMGLGAEFAREAQAKPLYARIIVTDRKPDDLPDCELVQATLIDGERCVGDALGQRVMQSTIYGTRTSMTRDMSVTEMLAASRKKMLMIYFGAPNGQDVQGLDNVEINLINMVVGLSDNLSEVDRKVLDTAIRSNPNNPILSEVLRGFSNIQALIQPQRGVTDKETDATAHRKMTRAIMYAHTQLEKLAVPTSIYTQEIGGRNGTEGTITGNHVDIPTTALALLMAQLQTVANQENIPLPVSLTLATVEAVAANDDIFDTKEAQAVAKQEHIFTEIKNLAKQLSMPEQIKLLSLVNQAQASYSGIEGIQNLELLDQMSSVLMATAMQSDVPPQTYAKIAKILPNIAMLKSEVRSSQAHVASAPAQILATLNDVHDVLAVFDRKALSPHLQEVQVQLNIILQELGRQEKGQIAASLGDKMAVALQMVGGLPLMAQTELGRQIQQVLVALTQPQIHREMIDALGSAEANNILMPDIMRVSANISQVIDAVRNIPRQYPQVIDAALTTVVLQSLSASSTPALIEKMEVIRSQGISGVIQAVHDGIISQNIIESVVRPYIQHNPNVAAYVMSEAASLSAAVHPIFSVSRVNVLPQMSADVVQGEGDVLQSQSMQAPTMARKFNDADYAMLQVSMPSENVFQQSVTTADGLKMANAIVVTATITGTAVSIKDGSLVLPEEKPIVGIGKYENLSVEGEGSIPIVAHSPPYREVPSKQFETNLSTLATSVVVVPDGSLGGAKLDVSALPVNISEARATAEGMWPLVNNNPQAHAIEIIPINPQDDGHKEDIKKIALLHTDFVERAPAINTGLSSTEQEFELPPKEQSAFDLPKDNPLQQDGSADICTGGPNCPICSKIFNIASAAKIEVPPLPAKTKDELDCGADICTGGPNCPVCSKIFNIASAAKVEVPPLPAKTRDELDRGANGASAAQAASAIKIKTDEFNANEMELGF